ncbi:MAG: hypothetical protein R3293_28230 [Candidatus Promineifilaceae bacterium]|nr:hypothetical protein [Candidatus Promineifilaceae bacterium]
MTELNFLLAYDEDTGLDKTAATIQSRLAGMEEVDEVEAKAQQMKVTGVEIAAAIGVTVLIVRGSRELVEEVRKLIVEIRKLKEEVGGPKEVYIDIGTRRVAVEKLSDQDIMEMIQLA